MAIIKTGMNNKQMKQIAKKQMSGSSKTRNQFAGGNVGYKKSHKPAPEKDASNDRYSEENKNLSLKRKVAKKTVTKKNDHDADDAYKKAKKANAGPIKHSGTFNGKSNQLGQGGRAAQMRARGVPGGVIGNIARSENAAPGQRNFHKRS